jgi:uncharacterized membrane protein
MSEPRPNAARFVWAALIAAIAAHVAIVQAAPRIMMHVAIETLSDGAFNTWQVGARVTPESRGIVRPSPDFAYSACVYDLSDGPVTITLGPWRDDWSLSLYADNSDNFFVIDDREARNGAAITLVRRGRSAPEDAHRIVTSPSTRGVALIRRLAPTPEAYAQAAAIARNDVCAAMTPTGAAPQGEQS